MEAVIEGEDIEIAFNYRFLLDLMNNFPGDDVILETSGSLNPGLFKSPTSSSFFHIIMPVRVQG
jgi:DNA polymerase-3 subunit beta